MSSEKGDALGVRRECIPLNTKKKHWPRKESRGEIDPSLSFK